MSHLTKSISLWQGTGLLVTTMMGTGVFILPQITAQTSGFNALIAWSVLVLLMIPVTLVFGTLGRKYPSASGPAHTIKLAFGEYQGQVIGLMFLLLVPVGAPAAIEITFRFVQALIPLQGLQLLLAELVFLVLIYVLNRKGLSLSGAIQSLLTLLMLTVVAAIFVSGGEQISHIQTASFDLDLFTLTMGLAFWSFMGIETMSHLSEEFRDPERDFGRALIFGVLIVGLIYLACTALVLGLPDSALSGNPLIMVDVFNYNLFGGGQWIIGSLGILSGAATVNVYIASTSRLMYSFASQKVIPHYWSELNNFNIPSRALSGILILIGLVLTLTHYFEIELEQLILWTNGVFVIIYTLAMFSGVKLLRGIPQQIAIVASAICIGLILALVDDMTYALALVLILSIWVRRHNWMYRIR